MNALEQTKLEAPCHVSDRDKREDFMGKTRKPPTATRSSLPLARVLLWPAAVAAVAIAASTAVVWQRGAAAKKVESPTERWRREQREAEQREAEMAASKSKPVEPRKLSNAASCVDKSSDCAQWKSSGECERNPTYMRDNCAASCNVCSGQPPSSSRPPPDPACKDSDANCVSWAAAGECEKNTGFMMSRCESSCHACDRAARCKWDENDFFLGVPAGSHAALAARTLKEWSELEPTVLSDDPLVVQLDAFLTASEAAAAAALGDQIGYSASEVLTNKISSAGESMDYKKSAHRDSHTVFCDQWCFASASMRAMLGKAKGLFGMPEDHAEIQLLKYNPGQYYRSHHDYLGGSETLLAGPRALTLFVYLSDVDEGGETVFPVLNLSVTPRAGRAVFWANVFDEQPLQKDVRTRHLALPVKEGVKYAANVWFYHRDLADAQRKGCVGG